MICAVPAVSAQEVVLTSPDSAIRLEGTLLGYDGEFYRLATEFGTVTVDAARVSCDGAACPGPEAPLPEIRISGERSMGEVLLPVLLETFALRNALLPRRTGVDGERYRYDLIDPATEEIIGRFHFHLTSTDEGFADLLAGQADLVMAAREVTATERALALDAGIGDLSGPHRARILALDGLVPAVSPANTLRRIAVDDLAAVRDGEIRDWSELGGSPGPIDLHGKSGDGGAVLGLSLDLGDAPAERGPAWRVLHESADGLADTVARSPETLGFVRYSQMGNTRPLALTGTCGRQITVSAENLKAMDYPLALPFYLYVPPRRYPAVLWQFLDWLNAPAAELAVRRAGYVDQEPVEIPLAAQGERLANAILAAGEQVFLSDLRRLANEMTGARRLTTTFRFRSESTRLDAQSEGSLDRLAQDLERGLHDGAELVLAGFSAGSGAAEDNRDLSLARAEAVAAALREKAPGTEWTSVSLTLLGLGEVMPLACDDTDWGQRTNRRVEVWLR